MAHNEGKLPWELIEEILSRVPPKSLVRFRTVAKQWNTLFDDKTFIKNHKTTFRFILTTMSKVYSVSIDPELVVRELTLDVSGLEYKIPNNLVDCNEFLICGFYKRTAVWNPWLEQITWIKSDVNQTSIELNGIGYDHNRRVEERVYKTIASYRKESDPIKTCWKVQDFASDTWKDIESESDGTSQGEKRDTLHSSRAVSLNGTLYWIAFCDETDPFYHLINFDFSADMFYSFCDLPCGIKHYRDALVLGVFRGDRFSLLKQCHVAKKIEIWVTKNKIDCEDGDDVVWMSFMTLSIPNFPNLVQPGSRSLPSYFIEDKRLVVCCCDETGRAWIYVVEENKLISSIRIDSVVESWPLNCTYFPSLVPVPRVQREEA